MGGILARAGRAGETGWLIVRRVPPPTMPRWMSGASPVAGQGELAAVRHAAEAPSVQDVPSAATEQAEGGDALPSGGWFVAAQERPVAKAAREVVRVGDELTAPAGDVGDAGAGARERGGSVNDPDEGDRPLQRGASAGIASSGRGPRREQRVPSGAGGPVERAGRAEDTIAGVTWRGSGRADSPETTPQTRQDEGAWPDWRDWRGGSGGGVEVRVGRRGRAVFDEEGDIRLELSR